MKHLLRYTLLLLTALLPVLAMAQPKTQYGATVNKYVTENDNGTYTISMETYARGELKQTPAFIPTDFVLVLDNSGSMSREANKLGTDVNIYTKSTTKLSTGTTLSSTTMYFLQKDELDYYLKYDAASGGWAYSLYEDFTNVAGLLSATTSYSVKSMDNIYTANVINNPTPLQALRVSVASFLRLVYANSPSATIHHRVAIVWYGTNIAPCSYGTDYALLEMTQTNMQGLVDAILTETPGTSTSTYCHLGLEKANDILTPTKGNGHNKVTIFFTDGEPGKNAGTFLEDYARSALDEANKIKRDELKNTYTTTKGGSKDYPSTLYSIGLMTSGKADHHKKDSGSDDRTSWGNDKYIFMHYVSSNYMITSYTDYQFRTPLSSATCLDPNCTVAGTHHGAEGPHGYFTAVSNASALNQAFARIAEKTTGGADNTNLDASSAVIMDVLTPQFTFPKDIKVEDIELYTCSVNPETTESTPTWMTTGASGGKTVYKDGTTYDKIVDSPVTGGHAEYWEPTTANIALDKVNKTVNITNFDFVSNFVGPIYDVNDNTKIAGWTGKKLIAQFTIERDPSNPGGTLNTNTGDSGLTDGSNVTKFNVPSVTIPTIIITKKGLTVGESAVFEVERVTSSAGTTPDATNKFKNTYILTKTGIDDPTVNFVTSGPGYYKVTEKTWTWNDVVTYDKNDDGTPEENGTSYVQELTTTNLEKTFTFGVGSSPKTSVLPRYQSEKNKNNDFGTTTP